MTFSIVVPVYNGEKFIESSVKSALDQNFEGQYEVILVENGSTDNTPLICDRLAEKSEIISVLHLGKIGLYMARQEGIKAAKGDYIVALDSDDELSSDLLKELSDYIEDLSKKGSSPDLIFYNAADLDTKAVLNRYPFETGRVYAGEDKKPFKDLVSAGDSLNAMWIKCIKRDIADLGIIRNGLNYGEDLFQTAHYIEKASAIAYLDKVLYYYRNNAESLTASYNDVYIENQKFVWNEVDKVTAKWNDSSYKSQINLRKALTCTINVTRIIYSSLSIREKKEKLCEFMDDSFYKDYALRNLPKWAPEESVFVHGLMCQEGAGDVLMANARKHSFKSKIKKLLGR